MTGFPFVLTWNPSHEPPPQPVDAEDALRDTVTFWNDWSARGTPIQGPYRQAITRSLLTLKALTYAPDRRHRRGRDDVAAGADRRPP